MAKKRGSGYKEKINQLTLGLLDTLIDLTLFAFFFSVQSYKMGRGKRDPGEAIIKAIKATKIVHPTNFKRLILKLKSKGYLERKKDYLFISEQGRKRLWRSLPFYEEERRWDGIIYLITYDIPEEKRRERDVIRACLQRLGCALLQRSVWLTPYNPKRIIAQLVKERRIAGLVLVSELREGSNIGGQSILKVLERVYKLRELNEEYKKFVQVAEEGSLKSLSLIMTYLSILKKDPQLPFELLPDDWWGGEAYRIYQKLRKSEERKKTNERK